MGVGVRGRTLIKVTGVVSAVLCTYVTCTLSWPLPRGSPFNPDFTWFTPVSFYLGFTQPPLYPGGSPFHPDCALHYPEARCFTLLLRHLFIYPGLFYPLPPVLFYPKFYLAVPARFHFTRVRVKATSDVTGTVQLDAQIRMFPTIVFAL
jgi:hypothetical protein